MNNLPLTIKETQEGLLKKDFSAVNLVDGYLSRISQSDKDLNIYLTVTEDKAYEDAKKVDGLIKDSNHKKLLSDFPLLGVSIAHKDIFLTEGIRTTAASKVLEDYIPPYSATSVSRIEKAGSILLGKVNCDAWAHGSSGENSDFGPTKNPWNREFTPGGSSSGSGAVLSANMALVSTGTDTCGSIRLPANYNGLVALKPTYGAVSRYGVVAMASSLDTVGPLTRTIEDTETIFNTIKGEDGYDSTISNEKIKEAKGRGKKNKLTIGIPKEFFGEGLNPEVAKNIEEAIEVYKKLGIEIKEVSLPSTKYGIDVYYIIQPAEVSSNLGRYDGIRYGNKRDSFGDEAKRRIMIGSYVLSAGYYDAFYLKAQKVRTKIINEINSVFSEVDALIAPVAPTVPFKLGEKVDDPVQMYLTDIYAATANLCGIPSLAIPTTLNKKGLPLGFQIMANRFDEEILFKLGKMYHKEIDFKPMIATK